MTLGLLWGNARSAARSPRTWTAMLVIVFLGCRLLWLDQDLPPWGTINYQPIDEGSYSMMAMHLLIYGKLNLAAGSSAYQILTPPHIRVNLVGNALSYISLVVLGRNYYGYRVPSVIWSFAILVLIFLTLRELGKSSKTDLLSGVEPVLLLALIASDYAFLVAGRVVEPSIERAFFNILAFYLFVKLRELQRARYFLLGFLITLSVFLVYLTNTFMYFPCAIVLVVTVLRSGWKKGLSCLMSFCLGFVASLVPIGLYYHLVWDTSGIANLLSAVGQFSSLQGYSTGTGLRDLIKDLASFFGANLFLYDLPLVAFSIVAFAYNGILAIRRKDDTSLFYLASMTGLLLQTLVSNDYVTRKLIVVYPFIVINIYMAWREYRADAMTIRKVRINKATLHSLSALVPIVAVTVALCVPLFRFQFLRDGTSNDFEGFDKVMVTALGLVALGAIVFYALRRVIVRSRTRFPHMVMIGLFVISLFPNVYMSLKYVIVRHSYTEKTVMEDLGKEVGKDFVFGEYANGFALYNSIMPVLNTYDGIAQMMGNDKSTYYFDYYFEGDQKREFLDNMVFKSGRFTVDPIFIFHRSFKTFGLERSMALYGKKPRNREYWSVLEVAQ